MGNHRFKLSDMIPNAWFHKLKNRTKHKQEHNPKPITHTTPSSLQSNPSQNHVITAKQQQHLSEQRKSYYFTRDFTNLNPYPEKKSLEPPRQSSPRRRRLSTKQNARIHNGSPIRRTSSSSDRENDHSPSWSTSCNCSVKNDSFISINDDDDDVDDMEETKFASNVSELVYQIPPIITKKKPAEPTKNRQTARESHEEKMRLSVKVVKEETTSTWSISARNNHQHKNSVISTSPVRLRLSSASSSSRRGVRLRSNSPRMRIQTRNKSVGSNLSQSFAVVKASRDPKRDFRKSMLEMIVENDIKKSKDLEELLVCYLSLNSDEYHDLIIDVFKQIWFEFVRVRLYSSEF